jgi:hypothetical protein
MPNRILKESICTSPTIEQLSYQAEALWYRLLVQCDDFGRYNAQPCVIRARCFPLRLGRVTDQDVIDWMQELVKAGLLWVYTIDDREYLQVTKWSKHQQTRAIKSKYPDPPEDATACNQLPADDSNSNHMSPYSYSGSYSGSDSNAGAKEPAREKKPRAPSPPLPAQVIAFREATGRNPNKATWPTITQAVKDDDRALKVWQAVIVAWIGRGHNPQNVDGMLDWYRDGIPAGGPNGRGIESGNRGGTRAGKAGLRPAGQGLPDDDMQRLLTGTKGGPPG